MFMKNIFLIGTTASNLFLFRKDFITSCLSRGYVVYSLVSEYDNDSIKKIEDLGSKVIIYNLSRAGLNPLHDIKSMLEIKSYIDKYQPKLVFSFFSKPVIYGSLAAKLAKVPKIIGMIEGLGSPFTDHPNGQTLKMKLVRLFQVSLYRVVFPFMDKIIFLNQDDPIDLIRNNKIFHRKNAIEVLGGIGLNLNEFPYSRWDSIKPITFIIVARLLVEKGIYEYLEAARIVKKKYPDVIFKVVGGIDKANPSGLSQVELDKVISTGIIDYVGFSRNVAQEIRNSAVFILPSYREGVPRSTQEAMAIGRPVITTDVPGCRDTVIDGVNGFLIPKWDVNALANKMMYFIEYPEQINIMGQESYKMAQEKFDAEKVNVKLLKMIDICV